MSPRAQPIARIRLSRSLPRLLALPVIGLVAGVAAAGGGPLLWPGAIGLVVGGAGAVAAALAVVGALVSLSIRLDVEEAAVRVSWLGGERTYALVPGPVTRVRLRGERTSRLTGGRRLLGGQLGAARLRDEEDIEVVRLAPTPTAILVPTDRGRLAIAAADEAALLDALSRAARARQRMEELAAEAPPLEAAAAPVAQPEIEVDPVLMTGIERALFERRMAEERAAAEAAAEAERASAEAAAIAAAEAAAAAESAVAEAPRRRGRFRRRLRRPLARPRPSAVLVLLPLVGTGAAWGAALLLDRMPDPGSDLGRLTALALVLAGPAASIGAIMARIWWPRLVGVVVAGGLAAAVFVGRSLIGG